MKLDVVVIGGGSAGYAAARAAADLGARVGIVDKGPLGGLCILRGCMPSKTLLRSSDIMSLIRRAKEFGLGASNLRVDLAAINDRKRRLIEWADRTGSWLPGKFVDLLYEDMAAMASRTGKLIEAVRAGDAL